MRPLWAIALLFSIQIATAQTLSGIWQGANDSSKSVEFFLSSDGYWYGKSVSDSQDGKIKAGHLMFQKCYFDKASGAFKGTVHPPDKNMSMGATLTFEATNQLKVQIKKGFLSKTLFFLKTEP